MTGTLSPQVRPATADDALALAMIEVESLRATSPALLPPGRPESPSVEERMREWSDWPADHPDDVLLVYDSDDGIDGGNDGGNDGATGSGRDDADTRAVGPVGYVLARCVPWHEMDARVCALHVLPGHRLRGHGRALLHAATTELWARGCGPVGLEVLEHHPVRDWYDAIGGTPVADTVEKVDGTPVRVLVYRWDDARELARRLAVA
ncbi:MAG: putative acetyltransferase [Nocardioidaceae bacterium]|nr:putative acetyltransferase [Nocardioidaceae bacterium]